MGLYKHDFCRHSNSGNFLTDILQNFFTPPFPKSMTKLALILCDNKERNLKVLAKKSPQIT